MKTKITYQEIAQTGGFCMVDYFIFSNKTYLGINNECIAYGINDDVKNENSVINFADITNEGHDINIKYPESTLWNREVTEETEVKGHFVEKCEEKNDHYLITMRNGVTIQISENAIRIFACENKDLELVAEFEINAEEIEEQKHQMVRDWIAKNELPEYCLDELVYQHTVHNPFMSEEQLSEAKALLELFN